MGRRWPAVGAGGLLGSHRCGGLFPGGGGRLAKQDKVFEGLRNSHVAQPLLRHIGEERQEDSGIAGLACHPS